MLIARMGKRTLKDSAIVRFLQDKFKESGLSTSDIETLTNSRGPFKISQGYAHQIVVDGTSIPSLEKIIGFAIALGFDIAEMLSALRIPQELICSCSEELPKDEDERKLVRGYLRMLREAAAEDIRTAQGTIGMALAGVGDPAKKEEAK